MMITESKLRSIVKKILICEIGYHDYGVTDISPETIRQIVSIGDVTGILSWPDLKKAVDDFQRNPTLWTAFILALSAIAVIPVLGKTAKPGIASAKLAKEAAEELPAAIKILRNSDEVGEAGDVIARHADEAQEIVDNTDEILRVADAPWSKPKAIAAADVWDNSDVKKWIGNTPVVKSTDTLPTQGPFATTAFHGSKTATFSTFNPSLGKSTDTGFFGSRATYFDTSPRHAVDYAGGLGPDVSDVNIGAIENAMSGMSDVEKTSKGSIKISSKYGETAGVYPVIIKLENPYYWKSGLETSIHRVTSNPGLYKLPDDIADDVAKEVLKDSGANWSKLRDTLYAAEDSSLFNKPISDAAADILLSRGHDGVVMTRTSGGSEIAAFNPNKDTRSLLDIKSHIQELTIINERQNIELIDAIRKIIYQMTS